MIPASLKSFMDRLLSATDNGELRWKEGATKDAYFCERNDQAVHISFWYDPDRERSIYTVRLIKPNADAGFSVLDYESDFTFIRNLFEAVEANAGRFDKMAEEFFA